MASPGFRAKVLDSDLRALAKRRLSFLTSPYQSNYNFFRPLENVLVRDEEVGCPLIGFHGINESRRDPALVARAGTQIRSYEEELVCNRLDLHGEARDLRAPLGGLASVRAQSVNLPHSKESAGTSSR